MMIGRCIAAGLIAIGLALAGSAEAANSKIKLIARATPLPDSARVYGALSSTLSQTQKILADQLIRSLKASGVWASLDGLWSFAAPDSASALINWRNPSYNLVSGGSPVFTAWRGMKGDGSTASLTLGNSATWATGLPHVSLNSAFAQVCSNTDIADNGTDLGVVSLAVENIIIGRSAGNAFQTRANDTPTDSFSSIGDSLGCNGWSRTASGNYDQKKNGSVLQNLAVSSIAVSPGAVSFLRSTTAFSQRQLSFGLFGGGLSSSLYAALNTAIYNYLTGIGASPPASHIRPALSYGVWPTTTKSWRLTFDGVSFHDVGWKGLLPDYADGDAYCNTNPSQTCRVCTGYNNGSSTNADATQVTLANCPVWSVSNSVNGFRPVVFPLTPDGAWHWLTVGSGFTWSPGNPTVVIAVVQPQTSYATSCLFSTASNNVKLDLAYGGAPPTMAMQSAAPAVGTTPADIGPMIAVWNWQSGTLTVQANGRSSTVAATTFGSTTGANWGCTDGAGTGPGGMFDLVAAEVYTQPMTAEQVANEVALFQNLFNIPQSCQYAVVNDTDSLWQGKGSSLDNSALKLAAAKIHRPACLFNIGVVGQTLATMVANFSANFANLRLSSFDAAVVFTEAGLNDVRAGATPDQVWALKQQYVNKVHAQGPNVRVVVSTEPLQTDGMWTDPTQYAAYQNLVTRTRTLWRVPQSQGGLGADGLADLAADTTISTGLTFPTYPAGPTPPFGSSTYSAEPCCHPTDTSDFIAAPIIAAAINNALP